MINLALLVTGVIAGTLGALLGLGGGTFLVPALTLLFHFPIHTTVATSLVGVIATSAGVAAVAPRGRGADVALALRLEVATTASAIAGSLIASWTSPQVLTTLFALIVFSTAAYLLYKALRPSSAKVPERLFSKDYHLKNWPIGLAGSSLEDIHPLVVIPTALGVFFGAMLGAFVLPRLRWLGCGWR